MRRSFAFAMLAASLAVAGCQPSKSPEEVAAERNAAAIAKAADMAAAMDPNMTAEERARLKAVTGAMASGQVHPAASAYVTGLEKVFVVISDVKDDATANAAKPKLEAIYAEMAGPAAQLKAMSETDREAAFGSAYPQLMSFGMKTAGVMMPLMSNPDLAEKVGDLLDDMPEPE
jgi:hypothetical protein